MASSRSVLILVPLVLALFIDSTLWIYWNLMGQAGCRPVGSHTVLQRAGTGLAAYSFVFYGSCCLRARGQTLLWYTAVPWTSGRWRATRLQRPAALRDQVPVGESLFLNWTKCEDIQVQLDPSNMFLLQPDEKWCFQNNIHTGCN